MVNLGRKSHFKIERKANMSLGKLITFEGIECSGKGTQITKLLEHLVKQRIPIFATHEPGGTPYGEAIRGLLKHPEMALAGFQETFIDHSDFPNLEYWQNISIDRTPWTEIFMFLAARAEFIDKIISPKITEGINVISDRLHDSTRAYQGGGRFFSKPKIIEAINRNNILAMQNLQPDLTFLLDIPIEVMLERMKHENDEKNSYFEKQCDNCFFERVRQEYLSIQADEPQRMILIDATRSKEEVFADIKNHCRKLFC